MIFTQFQQLVDVLPYLLQMFVVLEVWGSPYPTPWLDLAKLLPLKQLLPDSLSSLSSLLPVTQEIPRLSKAQHPWP